MKLAVAIRTSIILGMACGGVAHAQSAAGPAADGTCPAGTHLVDRLGNVGIVDPDTFEPGDGLSQYRCAPDQPATSLMCGAHGTAAVVGGDASCECETGYAGDSCNVCAAGYEMSTTAGAAPTCAPVAVDSNLAILGGERTVAFGGQTVLSAERLVAPRDGSSPLVDGTWRIAGDPAAVGCLASVADATNCASVVTGSEAVYLAPASGTQLKAVTVNFAPMDGGPATALDLKAGPYEEIAINGYADGDVLPIVYKVLDFMKSRCVGAASLGIAKQGKVVAALGFGMKDGRNAETIWNPGCSSDSNDPYKPQAGEMNYDTPYTVGSVSKAISFATARWALKGALREQDADIRVIGQSENRAVSASRQANGTVRVDVWDVNNAGTPTRRGVHVPTTAKDFSLVRTGDTRFVLITRTAEDTFQMYAYSIDAAGVPAVTDSILGATKVKEVEIAAVTDQRVVIGMRRDNDALQMRVFKFNADGSLTQQDLENGGTARSFRLVALPGTSRVVGAARLGNPDVVKFIVWNIDAAGQLTRIHENELESWYWETGKLEMSGLSGSRFVVAARKWKNDPVGIEVYSVSGSGAISLTGATGIDSQRDFRVQGLDASHFAIASRDAAGNGKVQQFSINASGIPMQVGNAVAGGKFVSLDVGNLSQAGFGPGFVTATRDQNDTLRFSSWDVGASSITKLGTANGGAPVRDHAWTDADVEALQLVGYDFPDGLAPKKLHNIVAGYVQPPMHFNATDSRTKNSCVATAAPGYPYADSRWKNIRLGQFFGHRAGLNVSTVAASTLTADYIDDIRGISTKEQWNAEQNKEIAHFGSQNVKDARQAVNLAPTVNTSSPDGFLVPQLGLAEVLVGSASMCLPNPQGSYAYSNTDPQWIRVIAEHVTGKEFTAPVGQPTATQGTLLDDFIKSELSITSTGYNAISARPAALAANGKDPWPGARPRAWSDSANSYYPMYWDSKRPFCKWTNGACDFGNPSVDSLNWNGDVAQVPLQMQSNGHGAATGSLSLQLVPHLKFLSKYWAAGYDEDPFIGEARNGVWTTGVSHNGAMGGTYAYAIQYAGKGCPGSAGVDLVISVNQSEDKLCKDKASCAANPPKYSDLYDVVTDGVCLVNWSKVNPVPVLN